jgi:CheY-like chemotaxis protein
MGQEKAMGILKEEASQGKLDTTVVENLIEIVVKPSPAPRVEGKAHTTPVILVVEDNDLNMKLVKTLIELEGYEVIPAVDAEGGLEILSEKKPDLILMDIQLPGMDGLAATRQIKAIPELREIPVIALTSYAMQTDKEKAEEAGCDGFISKPIDTKTFMPTINHHLNSSGE